MAGYKPNLAENRAIHASEERGVEVPMSGGVRGLRPAGITAPHVGTVKPPRMPKMGASGPRKRIPGRKYYGE